MMLQWIRQNRRALTLASEVFALLLFLTIFLWYLFDGPEYANANLLFIVILVCLFLLSKQVYDHFSIDSRAQDIARTIADDLVASSQELFTELYRNSPIPYVLVDRAGTVLSANIASLRLFDVTSKKFEGLNIFDYLMTSQDDHAGILQHKIHSGISIQDEELQVLRSDGTIRWVQASVFFYKTKEGYDRGMLTLVDIDKHKHVDAAKSEFVSLASHQLRTPIAGMKWAAELIKLDNPGNLTKNQNRYLDRMLKSIKRMDLLVNDFLNVSRLELGTMVAEPQDIPIQSFVDEIFGEFTPQIVAKNITVEREYSPMVQVLRSDPNLLRGILANLISNAVKYCRQNGLVKVQYDIIQQDKFRLMVMDNGMGIPADEQQHIFTKIFRASNARKEIPEGTGLGLYIAKEAVKVLRGSIDLVSEEGRGTTFTVLLPFEGKLQ